MRRIVVLGGRGFFGSAIANALRETGHEPQTPRHADVDVEVPVTVSNYLRAGDVVIDAAGPFHNRTTALVDVATEIGFDVIDLSDSLEYALLVRGRAKRIQEAGIRVLSSCSAVSAVSASLIRLSQIGEPTRVSVCLIPASHETTTPGTVESLLRSVGRPVRLFRDGRLVVAPGWRQSRLFRFPLRRGAVRAYLTESADAVNLPAIWPSLRRVDFWVDTNTVGVNTLLSVAARIPGAGRPLRNFRSLGRRLGNLLGMPGGGFVVDIEGAPAENAVLALAAPQRSFMVAVMPAVLAAHSVAADQLAAHGLVPPDQCVDPEELLDQLAKSGVEIVKSSS